MSNRAIKDCINATLRNHQLSKCAPEDQINYSNCTDSANSRSCDLGDPDKHDSNNDTGFTTIKL